ncbi:hypothetical protein VaNZ11_009627 [Volvox africanus]|uniref:Mitochondrial carrier protein n=1 Tax=Volvox africanus TaxID=51714 RepID=A0ABQ5S9S5_9CHLO|nr:hypothetical protein VaNZ11_009627 [Volvox africanus]
MIAGSVAGTIEHTAMHPVDTIKTRMQALHPPGHSGSMISRSSLREVLRTVVQKDGLAGLYRGVGAVAAGAGSLLFASVNEPRISRFPDPFADGCCWGTIFLALNPRALPHRPAHALHFAIYEWAKEYLGGHREGLHPVETAAAGCAATVVNDALMTPVDSVKQRCQLEGSPYRGVMDAIRQMLRHEGIDAFFKSYRTTLIMNVPFTAMHFSVYETAKKLLCHGLGDETLRVQLVAGGLAGGCAAAVTTPLDVVKTRLQTSGATDPAKYEQTAVLPTLRQIVREEGVQALWQGIKPRVLFHIPAAAVCWGTYETMKNVLRGN